MSQGVRGPAAIGEGGLTAPRVLRVARKAVVLVIGGSVLAFGIALVVLPGPAIIVIPLGLAILGIEFLWARRLLRWLRERAAGWIRAEAPRPGKEK